MKKKLEMGKIVNTVGIKGEVKVILWCDSWEDFLRVKQIDVGGAEYTVEAARPHKAGAVLQLAGVESIEQAEKLKNQIITVKRELLGEPPEGSYYISDLLGLSVYETDGRLLGEMTDWLETGRHDVYVIRTKKGKEFLIPAISEVIKEVDIQAGKMTVTLLEGLVEPNEI